MPTYYLIPYRNGTKIGEKEDIYPLLLDDDRDRAIFPEKLKQWTVEIHCGNTRMKCVACQKYIHDNVKFASLSLYLMYDADTHILSHNTNYHPFTGLSYRNNDDEDLISLPREFTLPLREDLPPVSILPPLGPRTPCNVQEASRNPINDVDDPIIGVDDVLATPHRMPDPPGSTPFNFSSPLPTRLSSHHMLARSSEDGVVIDDIAAVRAELAATHTQLQAALARNALLSPLEKEKEKKISTMANTSTPIIKEEEEDPFSLLPHTTTSSSLSSSSEEDPLSFSSSCRAFWNNTTTSSSSSSLSSSSEEDEDEDEDDEASSTLFVLNLPPHMTTTSSSTSSSISSITTLANTGTPIIKVESSSSDEDEDDEALFVVNLPPHTTTSSSSSWSAPIVLNLPPHMTSSSSTSSSISSITTPFLEQPLLLIEILEDRNIYTDDIEAYQYLVHHQGPGYSATSYSFNVVVHYLLPNVQIQHTVNINHQDDDVHLLFYNNTHPMGISINDIFVDDNADDFMSIGSASLIMFDRNDGFDTPAPTAAPTSLLLDPSASINQLYDHLLLNPDDFDSAPTAAAPTYNHLLLDPSYVYDPNDFIIEV
ncbi:hypothetical protein FRACYDRAFT_237946 [Fragilariopsis cylindrus CCMP1102]|uniref:Uncharacterized protein n=1 Tax=Fragilariopsis cylindrus CCMP1102 TaxID=635003 RepID=A0A1E7FHB3_9STRA|nr:hypothetical protein FRACYDRAFT_237946 [Fragilariopsis cylindrus CCMP1102]|eukprot:OEU17527.1 hypothetical protein FRACYDRAFT_237946 [Fragilariopsis cylindrus CCMP1102]